MKMKCWMSLKINISSCFLDFLSLVKKTENAVRVKKSVAGSKFQVVQWIIYSHSIEASKIHDISSQHWYLGKI